MHSLSITLIAIALAIIVAVLIALLKLGSGEILRLVEDRWKGKGVVIIITCWILLLPFMMLASILFGLYRFFTVKPYYA